MSEKKIVNPDKALRFEPIYREQMSRFLARLEQPKRDLDRLVDKSNRQVRRHV